MPKTNAYLDHNASTILLPQAKKAIIDALDLVGNPSAIHKDGRVLETLIEDARKNVAKATGAKPSEVVFTGSATESINQAIIAGVKALKIDKIIVSSGEHAAALNAAKSCEQEVIEVFLLDSGQIDISLLKDELQKLDETGHTALVCVHEVNNETGIIQPVKQIETLVGASRHFLFIDAVQAFGKTELNFSSRPVDMMAVSAHKAGGPVGIGALLMKSHCDEVRFIHGGGQEKGRRSGTLSAPLIAGFGAAARQYPLSYDVKKISQLVKELEAGIKKLRPDAVIFGQDAPRMGNIINFAVPELKASVALMGLDIEGVSVSSGSACSSGKVTYSHVLCAMGISPKLATGRLRLSLGWNSTKQDVEAFLNAYEKVLAQHEKGTKHPKDGELDACC